MSEYSSSLIYVPIVASDGEIPKEFIEVENLLVMIPQKYCELGYWADCEDMYEDYEPEYEEDDSRMFNHLLPVPDFGPNRIH